MPTERIDEALLVKYLLGKLSEPEEVQVEDRAFANSDYLATLEALEADLIDTYVRGGLSQPERRAFERRFLTSPTRQSKVEFARALAAVAAESAVNTPAPRQTWIRVVRGWSPALRLAAGIAAIVCIVLPGWLAVQNATMSSRVATLEAQRSDLQTREQQLRRQLRQQQGEPGNPASQQQQPPDTGLPVVSSLVLLPGLSRAEAGTERLVLNPAVQIAHIEIQLEARDDYPRFRAELRTRSGEDVLTRGNLARQRTNTGYSVSFDVPATALRAGQYELALKGVATDQTIVEIGYYYFGVQKP